MAITDYYSNFTLSARSENTGFTGASYGAGSTQQGFIQPVNGNDRYKDGKSGEEITHRLYCDTSVSISYGDRITQNSVTYIAVYTIQPAGVAGVNHHKEILLSLFK